MSVPTNKRRKPCEPYRSKTRAVPRYGWISSNWSGYVKRKSRQAYRRISAEWTVPYVFPSSRTSYSSAWIGIDGFTNNDLIQTGTAHDWIQGRPVYYAWWEILPDTETIIHQPVNAGDCMRGIITKITRHSWCIHLSNLTKGWTFRTVQRYSGPQSSAEWIVEAPSIGGSPALMPRLSPISFRMCRLNGRPPAFSTKDKGIMVQNQRILSVPGPPNSCRDGFVVQRVR